MDVGVGCAIFASALVSKDARPKVPSTTEARMYAAICQAAPMLALGMTLSVFPTGFANTTIQVPMNASTPRTISACRWRMHVCQGARLVCVQACCAHS